VKYMKLVKDKNTPEWRRTELKACLEKKIVSVQDVPPCVDIGRTFARARGAKRGDAGGDGVALDRSVVCQTKDRPNVPIEAGDVREFLGLRYLLEKHDEGFTDTQYVYSVSSRTKVRSGAKQLQESGIELHVVATDPAVTDSPVVAVEDIAAVAAPATDTAAVAADPVVTDSPVAAAATDPADLVGVVDVSRFTPSQNHALDKAIAFYENPTNKNLFMQMPGGWGKTSISFSLFNRAILDKKRVLILANSIVLVNQLRAKFSGGPNTVVATYQSLPGFLDSGQTFHLIIADEAHHLDEDNTWRANILALREKSGEGAKLFGMSALYTTIKPDVVVSWETALDEGRIADYAMHAVRLFGGGDDTSAPSPKKVASFLTDALRFRKRSVSSMLPTFGDLTIVFWGTCARAENANARCQKLGLCSECLTGNSPDAVKARFSGNNLLPSLAKLEVIHVCGMLVEGVDIPFASTVVFGDDVLSAKGSFQRILRASRVFAGKPSFNIVCFVGGTEDSCAVGVGAISHMMGMDARMKRLVEWDESAGEEGVALSKKKLRRSRRLNVVAMPPPSDAPKEVLDAFDADDVEGSTFDVLFSATGKALRGLGSGTSGSERDAIYQARVDWYLKREEPVLQRDNEKVCVSYTFLGMTKTDSFSPGSFLNTARQVDSGTNTTNNIILSRFIDQLKTWRFWETGCAENAEKGTGPARLVAWVDSNGGEMPKNGIDNEQTKMYKTIINYAKRHADPHPLWINHVGIEEEFRRLQSVKKLPKHDEGLDKLASLDDIPNYQSMSALYQRWNRITKGELTVPADHPLRSKGWAKPAFDRLAAEEAAEAAAEEASKKRKREGEAGSSAADA